MYEAIDVCMPSGPDSFGGSVVMSLRAIVSALDAKFGGSAAAHPTHGLGFASPFGGNCLVSRCVSDQPTQQRWDSGASNRNTALQGMCSRTLTWTRKLHGHAKNGTRPARGRISAPLRDPS